MPVCDSVAKFLSASFPATQIVWGRYLFHFMTAGVALLLLSRGSAGGGRTRLVNPWLQLWRGLALVGSSVLFFLSLRYLPLADALALMYVAPLVVTLLSPWVLGERVGVARGGAVAVGFLGVLLVLRPHGGFVPATLLALASGLVLGGYFLLTRLLSGQDPPLLTNAVTALFGVLVMSLLVLWQWTPLTLTDLGWMALMGTAAAFGHMAAIFAFRCADASLLAPIAYVEIVFAVWLGYLIFGDVPQPEVWIGMTIIIAGGGYLSWSETRRPADEPAPPAPD